MSNADFLQARVESLEKLLRDLANTTNKNKLEKSYEHRKKH